MLAGAGVSATSVVIRFSFGASAARLAYWLLGSTTDLLFVLAAASFPTRGVLASLLAYGWFFGACGDLFVADDGVAGVGAFDLLDFAAGLHGLHVLPAVL